MFLRNLFLSVSKLCVFRTMYIVEFQGDYISGSLYKAIGITNFTRSYILGWNAKKYFQWTGMIPRELFSYLSDGVGCAEYV